MSTQSLPGRADMSMDDGEPMVPPPQPWQQRELDEAQQAFFASVDASMTRAPWHDEEQEPVPPQPQSWQQRELDEAQCAFFEAVGAVHTYEEVWTLWDIEEQMDMYSPDASELVYRLDDALRHGIQGGVHRRERQRLGV